MGEPSISWVEIEVSLEEKWIVSMGSSSARASNMALRCTDLGPTPSLHQAHIIRNR